MVPEGWDVVELKDLLDGSIKNGFSPNAAESDTGYWILGLGALGDEGINSMEIKPVEPEDKVLQSLLKKDDFLVSRSNTPEKVGRSIRFRGEIENCSYPDLMMRFRIDQRKVDILFIEQLLKSSSIRSYFRNCAAGSSGSMVKINKGILEKTPLVKPPLGEQKKIAQILSTWDKAITVTEKLLANSQQQKKALMQQLLTGKKRLLDKDGVRFGGEWKSYELGDWIREYSEKSVSSDQYEVLTSSRGGLVKQSEYFADSRIGQRDNIGFNIIPPGYITYRSRSDDGQFFFNRNEFSFTGIISIYYPVFHFPDGDSTFFLNYLNRSSSKFSGYSVGTSQKVLSLNALKSFKAKLPRKEEQQKIAKVLSAADQEISALQQKLGALKQEKKALMQQLLTGKRRVKT